MKYLIILLFPLFIFACNCSKKATDKNAPELNKEVTTKTEQVEQEVNSSTYEMNSEEAKEYQIIQSTIEDSVFAQIQRTPCFGRCPTYKMTVYQSGYVVYKGKRAVDKIGTYIAFVDQKIMNALITKASAINFFGLNEFYDNKGVTDLPSTLITINNNGDFKTVIGRYNEPREFSAFGNYFDELFKDINWTKIKAD